MLSTLSAIMQSGISNETNSKRKISRMQKMNRVRRRTGRIGLKLEMHYVPAQPSRKGAIHQIETRPYNSAPCRLTPGIMSYAYTGLRAL